MWLVRPFFEVLNEDPVVAEALSGLDAANLGSLDPDDRVPITFVHELLTAATAGTGDADLGLKAARRLRLGDAGVIDYLVSSVDSVRQALDVATRYMRLINDALQVDINVDGERAVLRLINTVTMPRAASDFQLGGLYRTHLRAWLGDSRSELEIWLPTPRPGNMAEYELTFEQATLRFEAPFSGYTFPAPLLDRHLGKADAQLHEVLRRQAERIIADLPRAESFAQRVRDLVTRELGSGDPTAARIAKRLGMSTSTLARRLDAEGTSFRDVVDDLRKRLAVEYVGNRNLELSEVALLLGFSQSPAFYRAFRRWTGKTPLEYRRQRRW